MAQVDVTVTEGPETRCSFHMSPSFFKLYSVLSLSLSPHSTVQTPISGHLVTMATLETLGSKQWAPTVGCLSFFCCCCFFTVLICIMVSSVPFLLFDCISSHILPRGTLCEALSSGSMKSGVLALTCTAKDTILLVSEQCPV